MPKTQNKIITANTAELTLQQQNKTAKTLKTFQTFLYNTDSPAKQKLEQFISDTFAKYYDAQIFHFYPHLLGAYNEQHQPYAAVGYRIANERRLFLEQYLNQPIEDVLNTLTEEEPVPTISPLRREHIIEIGNLAATQKGACRDLFQVLTLHFHSSQFRWIVFTGTRAVRIVLKRMRLKTYLLTEARIDALTPIAQQEWGRYYDQEPIVMAIPINQVLPSSSSNYSISSR